MKKKSSHHHHHHKRKSSKKKIKFIKKWCKWFYEKADHNVLGSDLTHLLVAIVNDGFVFIHKSDENEVVKLLEENEVSKKNKIWRYIKIEK